MPVRENRVDVGRSAAAVTSCGLAYEVTLAVELHEPDGGREPDGTARARLDAPDASSDGRKDTDGIAAFDPLSDGDAPLLGAQPELARRRGPESVGSARTARRRIAGER